MAGKLSYSYVQEYIKSFNYKLISSEYVNSKTKIEVECEKGHSYPVLFSKFQSGRRCPKCSNRVKITKADVISDVSSENYLLISDFINSNIPVLLQCPNGHHWKVSYQKYKQGRRCSSCTKRTDTNKKGHTVWNTKLVKEELEIYKYEMIDKNYDGSRTKFKVKCPLGHKIEIYWCHFLRGVRCTYCNSIEMSVMQRLSTDTVDSFLKDIGYIRIGNYINNSTKFEAICDKGHKTFIRFGNTQKGVRCKYCRASRGEKEVIKYLNKHNCFFDREVWSLNEHNRIMIFDFMIYDENSNILGAIEYDGQHHFIETNHFSSNLLEIQERDRRKDKYCEKSKIPLLRIPYTDFSKIDETVKNFASLINKL